MMPILAGLAVLILLLFAYRFIRLSQLPPTLSHSDPNDPEMVAAIANARKTLPYFWDRRANALNPEDYLVKVGIVDGDQTEHFWLENPSIDGNMVTGKVGNDPGIVKNVKFEEIVTLPTGQISDWMYYEGDKMHGNYTARVLAKPHTMRRDQYEQLTQMFAPLPDVEA